MRSGSNSSGPVLLRVILVPKGRLACSEARNKLEAASVQQTIWVDQTHEVWLRTFRALRYFWVFRVGVFMVAKRGRCKKGRM